MLCVFFLYVWYDTPGRLIQTTCCHSKTNIMMRKQNRHFISRHFLLLISSVQMVVPQPSGDLTLLGLYKRLVICFVQPFQLQSNVPTTANLGTEESGCCGEVAVRGQRCDMTIFSQGVLHVYCAQFMLTISHNGNNPIITK